MISPASHPDVVGRVWGVFVFKAGVDGKWEKMRMKPTRFQIYWEQILKQSMQHHES